MCSYGSSLVKSSKILTSFTIPSMTWMNSRLLPSGRTRSWREGQNRGEKQEIDGKIAGTELTYLFLFISVI